MRYRKKPVTIEAVPAWMFFDDSERLAELPQWAVDAVRRGVVVKGWSKTICCLVVKTREGDYHAGCDDMIIRGVKGEIYPCKPDIFAMTYEPVEEN